MTDETLKYGPSDRCASGKIHTLADYPTVSHYLRDVEPLFSTDNIPKPFERDSAMQRTHTRTIADAELQERMLSMFINEWNRCSFRTLLVRMCDHIDEMTTSLNSHAACIRDLRNLLQASAMLRASDSARITALEDIICQVLPALFIANSIEDSMQSGGAL